MSFFVENGIWRNVFAVPCEIVDKHIKLCSALSMKVLMVLLRFGEMDIDAIADTLGQSRADVQDALNYWVTSGIVTEDGAAPTSAREFQDKSAPPKLTYVKEESILPAASDESNSTNAPERKAVMLSSARPKMTTREINEIAETDHAVGYLLQETQNVMGKPLTPVATDVIAALYAYYGMEPDIILMLVQYCVSIGKTSVHYMEKVAATWIEKGISSHELAEAEIMRLTRQKSAEEQIRSMFGISGRALAASEKAYIEKWVDEWKMEFPLISAAFERAVEMQGKLSFAYINGILGNWHESGIKTAAQAMHEINGRKNERRVQKSKEASASASYDMSKLESMITDGEI